MAGDCPGYSWDAGHEGPARSEPYWGQGKAGENSQPGGWLCKSSLQETVGCAGGKLPAGVSNDWVTCRSPSSASCYVGGEPRRSSPSSPCTKGTCCCLQDGGSMYSLACRTLGIIPREYCSRHDHGT